MSAAGFSHQRIVFWAAVLASRLFPVIFSRHGASSHLKREPVYEPSDKRQPLLSSTGQNIRQTREREDFSQLALSVV